MQSCEDPCRRCSSSSPHGQLGSLLDQTHPMHVRQQLVETMFVSYTLYRFWGLDKSFGKTGEKMSLWAQDPFQLPTNVTSELSFSSLCPNPPKKDGIYVPLFPYVMASKLIILARPLA